MKRSMHNDLDVLASDEIRSQKICSHVLGGNAEREPQSSRRASN